MAQHARIEPGASVEARDGRFGTVREVLVNLTTGQLAQLLVEHDDGLVLVPADLILEIVSPSEVRLRTDRTGARTRLGGIVATPELGKQVRVPIHEERLRVDVQTVELGELRVHKSVERVPETVNQTVERDELKIERVRLDRLIDSPVPTREEDGWLIVPVMEEVLVVTKQLVLTEEVRIRTHRVVEEQEVYEILRREHVEIEESPGISTTSTQSIETDRTSLSERPRNEHRGERSDREP